MAPGCTGGVRHHSAADRTRNCQPLCKSSTEDELSVMSDDEHSTPTPPSPKHYYSNCLIAMIRGVCTTHLLHTQFILPFPYLAYITNCHRLLQLSPHSFINHINPLFLRFGPPLCAFSFSSSLWSSPPHPGYVHTPLPFEYG